MVDLRDCEPIINSAKINISQYLIYVCIVTMFIDISQGQGNLKLINCVIVCSVCSEVIKNFEGDYSHCMVVNQIVYNTISIIWAKLQGFSLYLRDHFHVQYMPMKYFIVKLPP